MDQKIKPRTCGDCGWYLVHFSGDRLPVTLGICRRVSWAPPPTEKDKLCMAQSNHLACPAYVRADPNGCYMPAKQGITEDQLRAEIKRLSTPLLNLPDFEDFEDIMGEDGADDEN